MQNNPNSTTSAAAAPVAPYIINLFRGEIFVYKNGTSGFSRGVTVGKKIQKFPQDKQHLDLVKLLYPGAIMHGVA